MLEKVKTALRITTSALDSEISDIIEACKADMRLCGINKIDEADPLIIRAIIIYAKANFSFSADNNKFQQSYDTLKCAMLLAGDEYV